MRHPGIFGSAAGLSSSVNIDFECMEMKQDAFNIQWGCHFGGIGLSGKQRFTSYYYCSQCPIHIFQIFSIINYFMMSRILFLSLILICLNLHLGVCKTAASDNLPIELENLVVYSKILGHDVSYSVILPPEYFSSNIHYPVIYLLHGIGGTHASWMEYGNVARVMNELIMKGEISPAIIVSPDGYQSYYCNSYDGSVRYEDFFTSEFIDTINARYRAIRDRTHYYICGFSMGGFGALTLALRHSDVFSACAALSASIKIDREYATEGPQNEWDYQWGRIFGGIGEYGSERFTSYYRKCDPEDIVKSESRCDLERTRIMLTIGDSDRLIDSNMELKSAFNKKGIDVAWQVYSGGHDFDCWNKALPNVLSFFLANGKTDGIKSNDVSKGSRASKTSIDGCTVYKPEENTLSKRAYPVVYIVDNNAGEYAVQMAEEANRLAKTIVFDSIAHSFSFAIRPMVICSIPDKYNLNNIISEIERDSDYIRCGDKYKAILYSSDKKKNLQDILIFLDKKMHR